MNILNVPGLAKAGAGFVQALSNMAERNGWDASGIAAVMAHESGFSTTIKNPRSTATGLIQFTRATAEGLGTSIEALKSMSAIEQLVYVEKFFQRNMPKVPKNLADYELVVLGRGNLVGSPDETSVYSSTDENPQLQAAYQGNRELDRDGKGYISVGDIRARMARFVSPSLGSLDLTKLAVVGGAAELVFLLGGLWWMAMRRKRKSA